MFNFFQKKKDFSQNKVKPTVLLVLDGWGVAPPAHGNAIDQAKKPNFDRLRATYPNTQISASGESVGLPAGEEGNSEVGHLTMSTGRVVLQSLPRINKAIEDGTFFDNYAFTQILQHIQTKQSRLHLMGLIGTGKVHASIKHLYALLEWCQRNKVADVYLHLFTDGRDSPPQKSHELVESIEKRLLELKFGTIASVSGRYYAMDRDHRWERTKATYDVLVHGVGRVAKSAADAIKMAYDNKETDEFIEPTVIVRTSAENAQAQEPVGLISDNDAVLFFNFRIDRPRQLAMAFTLPDFEKLQEYKIDYDPHAHGYGEKTTRNTLSGTTFDRGKRPEGLFFVTMTEYQRGLPVSAIAFPPGEIADTAAHKIAENNLRQIRIAESEKERMVTFYFNGLREERSNGEEVVIVPSPKVATYDKKIEMNLSGILEKFHEALSRDMYRFFLINFANPDMVAHSGSVSATIKAIERVDKAIGEVADAVLSVNGTLIITADHGNAEQVTSYSKKGFFYTTQKGTINTSHSSNPVPLLVIANDLAGKKLQSGGSLADVAPILLSRLKLDIPAAMTGRNLVISEQ